MSAKPLTDEELAVLWDDAANGESFNPKTFHSTRVWWKCSEGHSWDTFFSARRKASCPYCNRRYATTGVNDVATLYPHLIEEWASSNVKSLSNLLPGSSYKASWVCGSGHHYKMVISHKISKNRSCPTCESFGFLFPDKAKLWHPTKNNELTPYQVTPKSARKVWWQCEKGHEWKARVFSQHVSSCPYCSRHTLLAGFNDFQSTYPDVVNNFWDFTKNSTSPDAFFSKTDEKFYWKCEKGHSWVKQVQRMIASPRCPVCSNKQVLTGYNDLCTTHPEIAKQWNYGRNLNISPQTVLSNSTQSVWWIDEFEHEWESQIWGRTKDRGPCPYCKNLKVLAGFNDLATKHPTIASEWHPLKNKNLTPEMFTPGQDARIWWLCEKGHEWETTINTRTGLKTGCPICAKKTSQQEEVLGDYIQQFFTIERHSRKIAYPYEIDIYIPERKIAVEYNGIYWHSEPVKSDKHYHYKKWLACKEKGVQLIQVWEDDWLKNPQLIKDTLLHKLRVNEVSLTTRVRVSN